MQPPISLHSTSNINTHTHTHTHKHTHVHRGIIQMSYHKSFHHNDRGCQWKKYSCSVQCTWVAQINNSIIPGIYAAPFGARAHTLYIFLVYHGHIPGRQAAPSRGKAAVLLISSPADVDPLHSACKNMPYLNALQPFWAWLSGPSCQTSDAPLGVHHLSCFSSPLGLQPLRAQNSQDSERQLGDAFQLECPLKWATVYASSLEQPAGA